MYVYCAVNPSMPGLVKVGMTANQPSVRMGQLSSLTAVPTPFECSWYAYSANPAADEARLHKALERHRLASNREFFKCSPDFAKSAARSIGLSIVYPYEKNKSEQTHTLGYENSEWAAAGIVFVIVLISVPFWPQMSFWARAGVLIVAGVIGAIYKEVASTKR